MEIAQCLEWCMQIGNFWVYFTDNRYDRYGHIGTDTDTDKYIDAPLIIYNALEY